MKKLIVTLFVTLLICAMQAQDFDQYFVDKTLRIDYLHIGNKEVENFEIKTFHAGGTWNGTHHFLEAPHRYGDVLFEAFDATTGQLIFSKSYSCLFNEYRTTERGIHEIGSFEESILMPFPKNKIKIVFTTYNRRLEPTQLYEGFFDPKQTPYQAFVKDYKIMNLHVGNTPDKALDILFIPDGYTKQDKKEMKYDMKRFADYILNCSPFKENADKINIRAIEGYSEESGITDPNNHIAKTTLLNSSYNVIDLDRYLMCLNVWQMNAVADDAPYDIIVIVANSSKYGGGGIYNFYCTVNNEGKYSDYVIVHELGHLLAGLGDEYYSSEVSTMDFYPSDVEPVEPNLTTLVNFESKWKDLVDTSTPI
ncbi:MAG: M64 family metallopeptidase, partial [Bacteroidales bacterium]